MLLSYFYDEDTASEAEDEDGEENDDDSTGDRIGKARARVSDLLDS